MKNRCSPLVQLIVAAVLSGISWATSAQSGVSEAQRKILVDRLSSYGSCNFSCATDLLTLTTKEGAKDALTIIGLTKGDSKVLKGKVGKLSVYVAFLQLKESGGKIVDTYKVCVQTCDKLYDDIVELGSSGLLGPISKDQPVPDSWFENPKVKAIWEKRIRPLKASELPATFHNDKRWQEVMNTA